MNASAVSAAAWQARLRLEFRADEDRTRLVPRERYGPLAVQKPFYPEGDCCHVYLLHPPGGVVGGDRLELLADFEPGASALLTSPGAGKFYCSDGAEAKVEQRFGLARGARLEYLPQANIYFPGARVQLQTSLEIASGGRLLLWEKHCFGRPANRETFDHGRLQSRIDLRLDGRLAYTETQRIDAAELVRASGLRGHAVCGTRLALGDEIEPEALRELQHCLPRHGFGGVSQTRPGLLVLRYLGDSTAALDDYFLRAWESLRPAVMHRPPCHPRIWNT